MRKRYGSIRSHKGQDGSFQSVERHRDIIKTYGDGTEFVIIGLENQSYIDYTMPIRNMVYDGLNYTKQCHEFGNSATKWRDTDEFLSRIKRESRIKPIVNLIVYHGEKDEWDGPHKISDMMDIPDEVRPYFNDYRINVFNIRNAGEISFGNKDNRSLFAIIDFHCSKGKDFDITVFENEFPGLDINPETMAAVGALTECVDYMEYARRNKEKETINMCEAIRAIKEQGMSEGMSQGISQTTLLYEFLFNNNKTEELQKSFKDMDYQKELIIKYDIGNGAIS